MAGQLAPERIETIVGRAEVLQVFPAGKKDKAAGLLVLEGIIRKGLAARLTREDVIVSRTHIASLRRFKDDVSEVRSEEHTSELQSLMRISYAVFCLKKKKPKSDKHESTH